MGLAELIETKKMSKEEFEEHEHPRDSDGKFRKKNKGAKEIKGLSFLFKTKAMSKEEFEESEHPRGPDGKFVEDGKAGSTPKTSKGKHGGKRSFSGRTSKYASIAVPKRMSQYKKAYPDASEKEIEKMVKEDAKELGKPDWAEYIDNPEEYLKKEEKMREAAYRSKYGKAKLSRGGYVSVKNVPGESGEARASITETKAAFDREVAKQQILKDAWGTFRNEYSEKDERDRAKLVLLAGGIATILGVAALTVGRPKFALQGGLKNMDNLKDLKHMDVDGFGRLQVRKLKEFGAPDPTEAVPPEFIQFAKVTGKESWTEMEKAGAINKWITKTLMKAKGMTPEEGAKYGMRAGPKWTGYNVDRFRLNKNYVADLSDSASRESFIPKFGQLDAYSGKPITYENGSLRYKSMVEEALKREAKTGDNKLYRILKTGGPEGSVKPIKVDPKTLEVNFVRNKGKTLGEDDLKLWLDQKRLLDSRGIPRKIKNTESILPDRVVTRYGDEFANRADIVNKDDYRGYNEFMADAVIGPLSRRVLAGISISAGTGGMYYFQQDIASYLGAKQAAEKSRTRQQQEVDKIGNRKTPAPKTSTMADEIKKINAETKREEAKTRRELAQMGKETNRKDFLNRLVEHDIRRHIEGSQKIHSTKPGTVAERFTKVVDDLYDIENTPGNMMVVYNRTKTPEATGDFVREIQDHFNKLHGEGSFERVVLDNEPIKRVTSGKEFNGEIITKAPNIEPDDEYVSIDEIADMAAIQIIEEITDISQSCKIMIEGGVPNHTNYEAINDIITDIYINLKKSVKPDKYNNMSSEESNSEKTTEKSINPVDMKGAADYMSSQDDRSAGLFVPVEDAKFCNLCNKPVSAEDIARCDNPECPFTWLDAVIGDTDIEEKKDKEEETSDGQKEGTESQTSSE
jgi:hypothetical protein